jgi:transposase
MKPRYIKNLTKTTIKELEEAQKNAKSHRARQRAQAILLSYNKTTVNDLCKIFDKHIITIYKWLNRFNNNEIHQLEDNKGRGRKTILDIHKDGVKIKEYIKTNNVKETCAILNSNRKDKLILPHTLKRFLKKMV